MLQTDLPTAVKPVQQDAKTIFIYNQRRTMFAFILLTVSVGKRFSVIACVRSALRACACPSLLFPSRCDKAYLMYGTRRNTTNFSFH